MAPDVDELTRNASGIVRTLRDPTDGVYALLGLITLRLEDQHFDLNTWPAEARWEDIEEGDDKERSIQNAVSSLIENEDTESLGHSLKDLGLSSPSELTAVNARQGENRLEDLVRFVKRTDIRDFSPRKLSRISDELLFVTGDMGGSGQFFTPASLSTLIAKILNPEAGDSIYDPTAGSGGLLLSVQREADAAGEARSQVYGQEINRKVAAVARINARLHGVQADIRVADTLTDPKHVQNGSLQTFDVVVANPPMGVRKEEVEEISETVPSRFQFGPVASRNLDIAFCQHALSSVGKAGKAALIMPPRFLWAPHGEGEVVESILSEDLIQAVVQLPRGILPNTSIPPVLVVCNRSKPEDRQGKVFLVDAREECVRQKRDVEIAERHRQKIAGVVNDVSEKKGFSIDVEVREILQNGCNLSPARYILDRDITSFMEGFVEWKQFREIASVDTGKHVETEESGEVPVLTPKALSQGQTEADVQRYASTDEANGLPEAKVGDLILSRAGTYQVSEVGDNIDGSRCGQHVVRIRVEDDLEETTPFLVYFPNSDVGSRLLKSRTVGSVGSLAISDIRDLPVPIPGPDVLGVMNEVRDLEQELASQIEGIGDLRDKLFDLKGAESENSRALRQLSATAEVLSSSLSQSKDLDYRVRNFYPFPLAYTYRNLQSISEPVQQHDEILRIVENVVSFLACVGLSVGRSGGIIPKAGHPELETEALKNAWRGGIALGTWKKLAYAAASELHGDAETDLGSDYASIWFSGGGQSDFHSCIDELISIRNDASHGRGPTTQAEYREEVRGLHDRLETVYEEIEFFVSYPLHFVRNLDSPWDKPGFEINSLAYVGDHPGMDPKSPRIDHPVAENLLYIESGSHDWVPLHPIISVHHCPKCRRRETYALDKWRGEKKFGLKSFERGHGITAEDTETDIGAHASTFFAGE